jgi:dUTPase
LTHLSHLPRTIESESVIRPCSARRRRRYTWRRRLDLEPLELRALLSGSSGINIDSSAPVAIPIENTKAGQVIPLTVNFSTMDTSTPEDTENEWVEIAGSTGYKVTVYGYGTQTIEFPITQDGETISVWTDNTDLDEKGTLTVGDRTIEVNVDLAALAAPFKTFVDDLNQAQQAIESIFQYAPGWHFYPPKFTDLTPSGSIVGELKIAPDGSIDGGSVGLQGEFEPSLTTEAFWGLPAKLAGLSVSLKVGLGVSVSGEVSWDHGVVSLKGEAKGEGTATAAGNLYGPFVKASIYGKGAIELPVENNVNGVVSGPINLTFEVGGSLQYKGLTDKDYITLEQISTTFGPRQKGEWSLDYQSLIDQAVQIAENEPLGDPLVVTSQPPPTVAVGSPFGMVVTAENADGSVNTSFNGPVTVADAGAGGVTGTTTVMAVSGVATFQGLTFQNATPADQLFVSSAEGTVYTSSIHVTASAGSPVSGPLTPAPPDPPPAVAQFQFKGTIGSLPKSFETGVPIISANSPFSVTVDAEDSSGKLLSSYNGPVTLALGYNPTGATLGGTLTVNAASGVATFNNLTVDKLGSAFFLTTTGTAALPGASNTFNVDDYLALVTPAPTPVVAGTPFNLVVEVRNGSRKLDTSYNGNVTVTESNYSGGPTNLVQGATTVQAVGGVATFNGLSLDQAGNYSLLINGDNLVFTLQLYRVTPGKATQLVVTSEPLPALTLGSPLGLTVTAEDAFGNMDPTASGSVALAPASGPSGATLGGTSTATLNGGVASFSNVQLDKAGTYTLNAAAMGLTGATTSAVNENAAGIATRLVITTPPLAKPAAGAAFGLVVKAEDDAGTVDASYSGPVTVTLDPNTTGAALGGPLTVTAVNGVATFSNLKILVAGSYGILASSPGLNQTTSSSLNVSPGTGTRLVVSTPTGVHLTGSPLTVTVKIEDDFGNIADLFNVITLALGTNPGGATLGGRLTTLTAGSVATFPNLMFDQPGSGYTLTATAEFQAYGTLSAGTSPPFTIGKDQLMVIAPPVPGIAEGSSFGLVIEAENASGVVDTSFNGAVTLGVIQISGNPGTLGGVTTVTASNGVASFSGLSLNEVGTYALSASAADTTPITTTVFRIAAARLSVSANPPVVLNASSPFSVTVTAGDGGGFVDPTYNGPVTLALSGGTAGAVLGGPVTVNAFNGVATFSDVTVDKPGAGYTLTASAAGLGSCTFSAFNIVPAGTATQLVVTPPPGSLAVGDRFGLVVQAEDSSGNLVSSFQGAVTLTDSQNSLAGTVAVNAVGGVATFSGVTIASAWPVDTLTVSSPGLVAAGAGPITVIPAPATHLVVTLPQQSVLTGVPFEIQVEAEDDHGDVDPTYNGSVTLALGASPGGVLKGTVTVDAGGGVATFSGLSIDRSGQGYSIVSTGSGGLSGAGPAFDVTNDQLVFTTQPNGSVTVGQPFGAVVAAENGAGVIDTGFDGDITISAPGLGQFLGGTTTVRANSGVAIFTGLTLSQVSSQSGTLVANGAGLPQGTSGPLTVEAGAATQLVVTTGPPANATASAPFQLSVAAEDSLGNVVTSFNGDMTLALAGTLGGANLGGTITAVAAQGVATFTGLTLQPAGTVSTLAASAPGLPSVMTSTVHVLPAGAAIQLVITTQPPTSVLAGQAFGLVVDAEDGFGHLDSSYSGPVSVSSLSGATVGGTATMTAVGGIATFTGLTLTEAGIGDVLQATGSGLDAAITQPLNVNALPATQLVAESLGGNTLIGSPFSAVVLAEDPYGNIDPSFRGDVSLALANSPPGALLGGTLAVTASGGSAYFSGLTINEPEANYALLPQSTGLEASAALPFNVTADQFVVVAQPPQLVSVGAGFGLSVASVDGSGHVDTSYSGPVTVSLFNLSSGNPTLSGQLTVQALDGMATFLGLATDQPGNFLLFLSASGVGGTSTRPVQAIQANPQGSPGNPSGTPVLSVARLQRITDAGLLSPPIVIDILGTDGSILTSDNSLVTLAVSSGPAGGRLGGEVTVRAAKGVATFDDFYVSTAGTYQLTARDGNDMSVSLLVQATGISSGYGVRRDVYVNALYIKMLGRAVEARGLSFWSGLLAHRTKPKTVALAIWHSREHGTLVAQHVMPRSSFARAYADALRVLRGARLRTHPAGPVSLLDRGETKGARA